MKIRSLVAFALTALAVITIAGAPYVKLFNDTYGITKDSPLHKAKCAVCHIGATEKLNPYGLDMDKLVQADNGKKLTARMLKKLDKVDSDKDGVTNLAEIKKGTLPGDPKSK